MIQSAHPTNPSALCASRDLSAIVDEITDRLNRGEQPDPAQYAPEDSQLRRALAQIIDTLSLLHEPSSESQALRDSDESRSHLGDFRIIRELGRGGMGVVYEAEQLSLGRRVALKVLPFAGMLDQQQLNRFKNEARAAATLDHPNIVSIYSVGAERGVHYYAMQLIEGRSLAEIIAAMKPGRSSPGEETAPTVALPNAPAAGDTVKAALSTIEVHGSAAFSNLPAFESREYFRAVAKLGIQAAEALDHAHQNGILHRDIKPANLLVDDAGKLWVTDFGLARIEQDAGLTMTGDILGTLRYMSPEQALAKRVVVDHRSDVYSLGVTLYELLTLQPAFQGDDRQELLRQIAFAEPRKPRQVNPHIPQDLETIVLKAIEKNPTDRYFTAQEFAADLQRFVDDQPIKAKPQSLVVAVRKWSRRNRGLLTASAVTLVISGLVLAGSIGWVARDRAARRMITDAAASGALDESTRLLAQKSWDKALVAVRRADDLLAGASNQDLSEKAADLRKDIEMVLRLEQVPSTILANDDDSALVPNQVLSAKSNSSGTVYLMPNSLWGQRYAEAFHAYGMDLVAIDPNVAAEQIRGRRIARKLVSAIDAWAECCRDCDDPVWKHLMKIVRAADADPWRNRVRDVVESDPHKRVSTLLAIAAAADHQDVELGTAVTVAQMLFENRATEEQGVSLLRAAHRRHPEDFEVNLLLSIGNLNCKSPNFDEAIRFATAALALRPNAESYKILAGAFAHKNDIDQAIDTLREGIRRAPDNSQLCIQLSSVLLGIGRSDEAIRTLEEAIQRKPTCVAATDQLSLVLCERKRFADARRVCEAAVAATRRDLGPDHRNTLGAMKSLVRALIFSKEVLSSSDAEQAQKVCEDTLQLAQRLLGPDHRETLGTAYDLGDLLSIRGRHEEALRQYEETLNNYRRAFGPNDYMTVYMTMAVGETLAKVGRTEEAQKQLKSALDVSRDAFGDSLLTRQVLYRLACVDQLKGDHDACWQLAKELHRSCRNITPSQRGHIDEKEDELLSSLRLLAQELPEHDNTDECRTTLADLVKDMLPNDWEIRNILARTFATSKRDSLRDGQLARELANKASELTKYKNSAVLDTLACTYAETGDFESAVKWSQEAVKLAHDDVARKEYAAHLANFRSGKAWREPAKVQSAKSSGDHS